MCSFDKLPPPVAVNNFRKHCQQQHVPQDATDLLELMLSVDPSKRPSAAECLEHPFFRNHPHPMNQQEFRTATMHFASSHEFVVKGKGKGAKRGREGEPAHGVPPSTTFLCFALARCKMHARAAVEHYA